MLYFETWRFTGILAMAIQSLFMNLGTFASEGETNFHSSRGRARRKADEHCFTPYGRKKESIDRQNTVISHLETSLSSFCLILVGSSVSIAMSAIIISIGKIPLTTVKYSLCSYQLSDRKEIMILRFYCTLV